jgi:hypothetical protein
LDRQAQRKINDHLRSEAALAKAAVATAETSRAHAEAARDEAVREAAVRQQNAARLERKVARLSAENAALKRALRDAGSEPSAPVIAHEPTAPATRSPAQVVSERSPWAAAAMRLMNTGQSSVTLALANDVLRTHPDDVDALRVVAHVLQERRSPDAPAALRRLLAQVASDGSPQEAADTIFRLLSVDRPKAGDRALRSFFCALGNRESDVVDAVRSALVRLRGIAPDHHDRLAALLPQWVGAGPAASIIPPAGALGPADSLPLDLPFAISASGLLKAVDTNDEAVVTAARDALFHLRISDAAKFAAVWSAMETAASADRSALSPLENRPTGPIILDASNVAWSNQESLSAAGPRLQPILDLRRSLRQKGYFPVYLFGDAPLPFTIDQPERLRQMMANGEITLVDSGVDADEILVREARRLSAAIVTNDYMTDWDPENTVTKIRYALAAGGGAYLLADVRL